MFQLINPDTGSRFVDFHVNVLKARSGQGAYHHHWNAENLTELEGPAKVTMEGREVVAGPGEAVLIQPSEKHDVENVGDDDLRALEVKAPPDSDFIVVDHAEPQA
jgi:mannose-6-phosphate isomerase-like protein (cupin superfamily)